MLTGYFTSMFVRTELHTNLLLNAFITILRMGSWSSTDLGSTSYLEHKPCRVPYHTCAVLRTAYTHCSPFCAVQCCSPSLTHFPRCTSSGPYRRCRQTSSRPRLSLSARHNWTRM